MSSVWDSWRETGRAHRSELALERAREGVLPDRDLVLELGRGDVESLRCNVDALMTSGVGKENQRSG